MTSQKILQRGAEAEIILNGKEIIKRRVPKRYRLRILDEKIRKSRTKSEMKLLEKASKIISVPKILKSDENKKEIILEFIDGKKLSEYLDKFPLKKQKEICKSVGVSIARLHDSNIIHGDLTTSNMIYVDGAEQTKQSNDNPKSGFSVNISFGLAGGNKRSALTKSGAKQSIASEASGKLAKKYFKIFFIDFGLGFISQKIEDKAVDLHLLKQALESRHFRNWKILFDSVLKGYKISENFRKVFTQFEKVESRGRYKEKY